MNNYIFTVVKGYGTRKKTRNDDKKPRAKLEPVSSSGARDEVYSRLKSITCRRFQFLLTNVFSRNRNENAERYTLSLSLDIISPLETLSTQLFETIYSDFKLLYVLSFKVHYRYCNLFIECKKNTLSFFFNILEVISFVFMNKTSSP